MAETTTSLLSEHQAPELNTTNPGGYTPTAEEKKLIKLVNSLYAKAKRHRKKYDEHWLDRYKMFRGKQWREQRPTYRHSEVINFVFQAIQSVIPILTDSRPKFDYLPQNPMDAEIASILSEVATSDWEKNNWLMILAEILYDAHFYGTGFGGMDYHKDPKNPSGGICFESKDPFYCFPDPNARDINDRRSRYFIYAEPVDIDILKREYPDKKDYIKADLIDLVQGDKTDLDQVRFKSPTDNKTILEGTSAYDVDHKDQALKITAWIQSEEFDEEEQKTAGPDGVEQVSYIQKLRYPTGQRVVMAGGVICENGPNPYEDGLVPVSRCVNYILPREFWGISEIEQLESPQKIFNKLISFALDVMTLMGNPIWVVGTGAGVDTDLLVNRPGLVVETDNPDQIRREEGVQLQPYVLQLIDRMQTWFDGISGANDITRGVQPGGVTAAAAISDLQDAAQTRLRQKSRNIDAFLQSQGALYKNRAFQFYSAPQVIRLTENENAQKYFKFYIESQEQPDGTVQKVATMRPYNRDDTGAYHEDPQAKQFIIQGDFDVRVTTGSSLPFAKTQKMNVAIQMFDRGAIDEPELLKAADYPNWEAVWARVDERNKMKAQQAAQMEAAKKAPQAPAGAPV
jgi:hypothetical protein